MKKLFVFIGLAFVLGTVTTGCSVSGESGGPLKEIADVYVEMAQNDQEVSEAYQAVSKADRSERQQLHAKAISLYHDKETENKRLAEKAAQLGAGLKDTEIQCSSSEAMGVSIEKAVFSTVEANDKLCNIVISISCSEPPSRPYCLMMDKDNHLLWKTPANYSDGLLKINFRITRDCERAQAYSKFDHIVIVNEQEYVADAAGGTHVVAASGTDEPEPVAEEQEEKEAKPKSKSIEAGGATITVGAPLAETLKKAKGVTFDYNADFGVTACIGKVIIEIPDEDMTKEGMGFVNSILDDISPNIDFKISYIKPSAKIKDYEISQVVSE